MIFMKKVLICSLAMLLLLPLSSCSIHKKEYSGLTVSFLKVGKADAIVIRTSDHTVLIDAANAGEGKEIYEFCSAAGTYTLDYFILTHFDQDHVGGAKAVISKFSDIKNILEPDYEETNNENLKYQQAADEKGYVRSKVTSEQSFQLDDAVFKVYPAMKQTYKSTNDYSLVITMIYGKKAFLFAGDAENERLGEIMQQLPQRKGGYDLVKIPHHGQSEKKTGDFIEFLNPSAAVICCSQKEPADNKMIEILDKNKIDTFFTYNGTVTFKCDGYKISVEDQNN